MRIISGKHKGLNLKGFDIDGTRPTMDRVKESLFAIINPYIKDSVVLDLFAGSASLGLEALSNGASKLYLVEKNKQMVDIIKENVNKANENNNCVIIHSDYNEALNRFKNIKFDIIFLDPPYNLNLINDCLVKIKEMDLLKQDGIIVCEYESEVLNDGIFQLIKFKKYGSKLVKIYINSK